MHHHAWTWSDVLTALEPLALDAECAAWAKPLLALAQQVHASEYGPVFYPDVSIMNRQLMLSQTKDYDPQRGVLCVKLTSNGDFEFTYQDTRKADLWWRRTCPPSAGLNVLAAAVDHLHLLVRYKHDV